MTRSIQSRLGKFHDPIRRKLIDNLISYTGQATDCIKIRLTQTLQGDIETRTIESVDVASIIFPPLTDVPYRRLLKGADVAFKLETLPAVTDLFPFQIQAPAANGIYIGDLIVRIFKDPEVQNPYVMVLEVKEPLGTFAVHSMVWSKFNCTFYSENLPDEILETIVSFAERRLHLGW